MEKGTKLYTISAYAEKIVIAPDGQRAMADRAHSKLLLWDLESGEALQTLVGQDGKFTPDGSGAVSIIDGTLKIWNFTKNFEKNTWRSHNTFVDQIGISSDGRCAVSNAWDNTIKVWSLATCTEIFELDNDIEILDYDLAGGHNLVALTPDGKRAVTTSNKPELSVWDIERGTKLHTLHGHEDGLTSITITFDGKYAISGSRDHTVKSWDLMSGRALNTFVGHSRTVNIVSVTSNGRVISGSDDGTIRIWDFHSAKELETLHSDSNDGIGSLLVTPDDSCLVSNVSYGAVPKVWDLHENRLLFELTGHSDLVIGMAITSDGRHLVTASDDSTLRIWNLDNGKEWKRLEGHTGGVVGVTLTPDGQFAISASRDNTLKVWKLSNGVCVNTHYTELQITCCAIAPNSHTFLVGTTEGQVYFLSLEDKA